MSQHDDNDSIEVESAPSAASPDEDFETFVRAIDRRQHLIYGRVAFIALLAWITVSALAFWALSPWTLALMTCIGTALVTLFGMRAAIHLASRPLDDRVEDWRTRHQLELDDLVERARTTLDPRPEFFLSLVDGPMARQRRARRDAARSMPDPDVT